MCFLRIGTDIAIDLGTATVLVYIKGKGVILKEPSVVAIDRNNNKLLAIGEEARKMIGRTPGKYSCGTTLEGWCYFRLWYNTEDVKGIYKESMWEKKD